MKTLTNKTTSFEHNYHGSVKHSSSVVPEYTRHEIDVYNTVRGLYAVYQTATDYYNNSHPTPHETLGLSSDGGTDSKLIKVSQLEESDFENPQYKDYLEDLITELEITGVSTIEDLRTFYKELEENRKEAQKYVDNLELSVHYLDS